MSDPKASERMTAIRPEAEVAGYAQPYRGAVFVVGIGSALAVVAGVASALVPALLSWDEPWNLATAAISGFVLGLVGIVSLTAGLTGSLFGYVAARLAGKVGASRPVILALTGGLVGWAVAGALVWDLGSTPEEAALNPILPTGISSLLLAVIWARARSRRRPQSMLESQQK